MDLKQCRIIKTFKLSLFLVWNEFSCSLASAKALWPGNMAQIHAVQRRIQGFPKVSQTFSLYVLVLMGRENLMNEQGWDWEWGCWGSPWRGRVLPLQDFVQSTSGAGAHQGKAVCPSSWHTPLWLVGCCNVGSQPKPANELQILIPLLPLRKVQVPSYMFMGNRKIMIWSSFGLRFQNCSLMISLRSTGMLINWLDTL